MNKKKCLIIYPYFALYRKHIFDALFASDFGWDFELVGDKKCYFGIKGINPELAKKDVSEGGYNWTFAKNMFPLGLKIPFQWQPGVLKRLLRKDYDAVIMLGSIYYIAYIFAIPLLKFFKIPIIFWTHGFLGKDGKLVEFLRHTLYRQADSFLLYGERSKKIMKASGLYSDKALNVIYNSLDYGAVENIALSQSEVLENRRKLFKFYTNPIVVATGRVTHEKRFNLLLDALEKSINKHRKCFNLLIIGDGPELDRLKSLACNYGINEYINFTGAIYGDKVYEHLMISDLCVIPGNVGLSAMHALSAGLPVITHNNFDVQMPEYEAVIPNKTGSFYEFNNIDDMLNKIHFWIYNDNLLQSAASSCKEIIKNNYHVDYQIKVIENCLKDIENA